jgi:hypothetical protein
MYGIEQHADDSTKIALATMRESILLALAVLATSVNRRQRMPAVPNTSP